LSSSTYIFLQTSTDLQNVIVNPLHIKH